jgi:hypothetical protein
MSHVLSDKIYINCGASPDIFIASNTPSPSKKGLSLIGHAGNLITGEEPETIIEAANRCNREALSSADEAATASLGKIDIRCRAFTRNTGGNIFVLVFKRP